MSEIEIAKILIPRFAGAFFCGALMGWEREYRKKVAGIRTCLTVSIGAALYSAVPFIMGMDSADSSRIIAQIVTGVGFLGAGVIFHNSTKGVEGMTTAGIIWLLAAMGIVCGVGHPLLGCSISTVVFLIMIGIMQIEKRTLWRKDKYENENK